MPSRGRDWSKLGRLHRAERPVLKLLPDFQ